MLTNMTILLLALAPGARAAAPLASRALDIPQLPRWKSWTIARAGGPALTAYGAVDETVRRPVVLMVQGSKCVPLFRVADGRLKTPLFVADAAFFEARGVHALAIERRGIRSFEPIPDEVAEKDPRIRCSEDYGGLTKDVRVQDIVDALRALTPLPWFGELLIVGHSEGVDVALGAARRLEQAKLRGVGLLSGASPSMLFDFAVEARKRGDGEAVKNAIGHFFHLTAMPSSGKFGGYPVRRMLSFAVDSTPLDDALESGAPLFVANGTRDGKASVEAADYFVLEVLRRQPERKIRYVNYGGLDHDFVDASRVDRSTAVFDAYIGWSLGEEKTREFELVP